MGQHHGAETIVPRLREPDVTPGSVAARDAFAMAGVTPADVDACFLYDGFTPLVMHELEAFGFCGKGEAGPFVEGGTLKLGGALPTNTNGGLLSEGHMFGLGHVTEAVRQVRGACGERQVEGAEVVFVSGFGGAPHEAPPTASYSVPRAHPGRMRVPPCS